MTDPLDRLFDALRDIPEAGRLDDMESGVWSRIAARRQARAAAAGLLQIQAVVAFVALAAGVTFAQFIPVQSAPYYSETLVLADDALLVPSMKL